MMRHQKRALGAVALTLGLMVAVPAGAVVFTGSSGGLTASAAFTTSGTNLLVTLSNTGADVLVPADVLTAVFFNIAGNPALGSSSAVLSPGSTVLFDAPPAGGVVGGEWAYGSVAGPGGANQGISSAGFGLFGSNTFPGSDLDPPAPAVNGLNYGITSSNDNPGTGNAAVTGSIPLIQSSVDFVLSGLPSGFDLSSITNVSFQYGTALTEPNIPSVPEPGILSLIGAGLVGMRLIRRRRRS